MRKISLTLLPLLCFALSFNACDSDKEQTPAFHIAKSTLSKIENPESTQEAQSEISTANNQLSFMLYKTLQTPSENLANSAYSLFSLLSMLTAGSDGETKEQILETLHLNQERHQDFNALNTTLMRSNETFSIKSANALWLQEDFPLKTPFLDTLALQYGSGVYLLDFQKDAAGATETINRWIAIETKNLIKDLIPENAITSNTRLVLVNTLYLKGKWQHPFSQARTTFKNFRRLDGTLTQVQTMHQKATFAYHDNNETQVLSMSYKESDYALLSIMPKEGTFESFSHSLNNATFENILASLESQYLDLYYPRFHFSSKKTLSNALKTFGMVDAFSQSADFSPLSDTQLSISTILQETTINVDENGTEAAAATAIAIGVTGIPNQTPLTVKFDHPFIFALYHKPTHTILFLGQVLSPSR